MTHVDGNAVIGALSLALGTEMDDAWIECGSCGHDHPVAETRVYLRCPGIVLRCPNCSGAEVVLVEISHRFHITISGIAVLRIGAAASAMSQVGPR